MTKTIEENHDRHVSNIEELMNACIEKLGDICHEKYTGCQHTDRPIDEYDYCYTDEVINMLTAPEAKQALLTLIREVGEEVIGNDVPMEGATRQHRYSDFEIVNSINDTKNLQRSRLNKLVGGK